MLPRDRVINKLRELGFAYKKTCDSTDLWKKAGVRVFLPRNAMIEEKWIREQFSKLGLSTTDIAEFLRAARS